MKNIRKLLERIYSSIFIRYSKLYSRKGFDKFLKKTIEDYVTKGSKIINIGTNKETINLFKKEGFDTKDIDINPEKKPDYVLDINNMHIFEDNSIDVIICLEVFEHLKNPFKARDEIKRVLKKGGLLIGSSPFIFPLHDEPEDYFRFTKYGIINLFKAMKCLELKEKNYYVESIYVLFLRLLNISSNKLKIQGLLFFPFLLLSLPLFILINLIKNDKATTGYFYVFKKL